MRALVALFSTWAWKITCPSIRVWNDVISVPEHELIDVLRVGKVPLISIQENISEHRFPSHFALGVYSGSNDGGDKYD